MFNENYNIHWFNKKIIENSNHSKNKEQKYQIKLNVQIGKRVIEKKELSWAILSSMGRLPDTASKHLMKISMLRSHVASFK